MRYVKLLLNVGLIIVALCSESSKSNSCETNNRYLPNDIVPKQYSIELIPNMEIKSSTFQGSLMSVSNYVMRYEILALTEFANKRNKHIFI